MLSCSWLWEAQWLKQHLPHPECGVVSKAIGNARDSPTLAPQKILLLNERDLPDNGIRGIKVLLFSYKLSQWVFIWNHSRVCCAWSAFVLYCRKRLGKEIGSNMSQQQKQTTSAHSDTVLPRWERFCRWLWKHPLPFLGFTILANVAINIGSALLITPANSQAIPDTSLVGRIFGWIGANWSSSILLGIISIILLFMTWLGSRQQPSSSSLSDQTPLSEQNRCYMLQRLRGLYKQVLDQSLQGTIELELDTSPYDA
jgi:hypothetical protein